MEEHRRVHRDLVPEATSDGRRRPPLPKQKKYTYTSELILPSATRHVLVIDSPKCQDSEFFF